MNNELVPDLMVALGMTEREAKLYLAMIEKPEWKPGELHRITGIPRTQTHQTLELMVSRHYCMKRSEGRFNYYRATPPDTLKEMLLHRWEEETERRKTRAATALNSIGEVFKEAMSGDRSLDFIEIVQTPHRTHQRFMELAKSAEKEMLGFSRSPYSFMSATKSRKKRDEQTKVNEEGNQRGIDIKLVVMYEEDPWKFMYSGMKYNHENKIEEIRVSDDLPTKMQVIDGSIVMLSVNNISSQYKNGMNQIIIYDKGIATLCRNTFYMYWEKAIPFDKWPTQVM